MRLLILAGVGESPAQFEEGDGTEAEVDVGDANVAAPSEDRAFTVSGISTELLAFYSKVYYNALCIDEALLLYAVVQAPLPFHIAPRYVSDLRGSLSCLDSNATYIIILSCLKFNCASCSISYIPVGISVSGNVYMNITPSRLSKVYKSTSQRR